jgi:hypothetical protein
VVQNLHGQVANVEIVVHVEADEGVDAAVQQDDVAVGHVHAEVAHDLQGAAHRVAGVVRRAEEGEEERDHVAVAAQPDGDGV